MFEKIENYLRSKNWSYSISENKSVFLFSITGLNGTFQCSIQIFEETFLFGFITHLGIHCPANKQIDVLKLLNRLNNILIFGNFEMNEIGDIKHRTALYCEAIELTPEIIEPIIMRNIINIDFAAQPLTKFMFDVLDEDAVYEILIPKNLPSSDTVTPIEE